MRRYLPVLVILCSRPHRGGSSGNTGQQPRRAFHRHNPPASKYPHPQLAWWRSGGCSRTLLGAAYAAVAEEGWRSCLMFNPSLFNAGLTGGVPFGVKLALSEWTIGYHIVREHHAISNLCSPSYCFPC